MTRALALAAVLLLAGCHAAPSPAPITSGAAARTRWTAHRPAAYAYTLEISCMCLHRGRYQVEARDGRVVAARDAVTGLQAEEHRMLLIPSVEQLHARIQEAEQAGTPVRATYDATIGHPIEVEIGLLADDSGTLYRIEGLRLI